MQPVTNPLISVIMPVYNGEKYIGKAIESILAQTYQKFELIIINDNSHDTTEEIIHSYQKKHPNKISIISLHEQHGAFGAANVGIKQAKGELIAPMDADDISHPERFAKQVAYLQAHDDVIVVGTYTDLIDQNGKNIGKKNFPTKHKEIYSKYFEVHPMVHPSCMIRRSMLPDYERLYRDEYGVNDDYFTLFTLLNRGKFANIPETLFYYRIHLKNSSLQKLKAKFFNTVNIRMRAVKDFGYKPPFMGIVKFCLQVAFISMLPEQLIFKLYCVNKGILSFQEAFLPKPLNIRFGTLKN